MLREVKDAGFVREPRRLGGRRWSFCAGTRTVAHGAWRSGELRALREAQRGEPVAFLADGDRTYWAFADRFYWEDDGLSAADVRALIHERDARARRRLDRAHAVLAAATVAGGATATATPTAAPTDPTRPRREPIPRDVRLHVWERDGGRCVACGATFELQFDHVIPLALGGGSSAENLQLLCGPCNRAKGAALG